MMANFIVGALIGAFVGVIAGLWFAPQSGKETQRRLRKEAIRLRQQLGDSVDGARAEIEHVAENAKTTAQATVEEAAHKVDRAVQNGQQAVYDSVESITQAVNRAQRTSV
jgi:gas vesicle protein